MYLTEPNRATLCISQEQYRTPFFATLHTAYLTTIADSAQEKKCRELLRGKFARRKTCRSSLRQHIMPCRLSNPIDNHHLHFRGSTVIHILFDSVSRIASSIRPLFASPSRGTWCWSYFLVIIFLQMATHTECSAHILRLATFSPAFSKLCQSTLNGTNDEMRYN